MKSWFDYTLLLAFCAPDGTRVIRIAPETEAGWTEAPVHLLGLIESQHRDVATGEPINGGPSRFVAPLTRDSLLMSFIPDREFDAILLPGEGIPSDLMDDIREKRHEWLVEHVDEMIEAETTRRHGV